MTFPDNDAVYRALTHALAPARRAWVQAAGAALAHTGLSTPLTTTILLAAREPEGIQQNVLAERAGVDRATMTRTLDQAAEAGLLERRGRKDDRRVKRIHALPAGLALAQSMEADIANLRGSIFGDLPLADIEAATALLSEIELRLTDFVRAGA